MVVRLKARANSLAGFRKDGKLRLNSLKQLMALLFDETPPPPSGGRGGNSGEPELPPPKRGEKQHGTTEPRSVRNPQ